MLNKILLIGYVTGNPRLTSGRNGALRFDLTVDDAPPPGVPGGALVGQHFLVTAPHTSTEQGPAGLHAGDMVFIEGRVQSRGPRGKTRAGGGPVAVIAGEMVLLAQGTDPLTRAESPSQASKRTPHAPSEAVYPQPSGLAHFCAISPDMTREILAILTKIQGQPMPPIRFPVSPLWVEFEASSSPHGHLPCQAIWTTGEDAQRAQYQVLTWADQVKTLTIPSQGAWTLEQGAGCDNPSCQLASQPPSSGTLRIDERPAGQSDSTCACAQEGRAWRQLISVLGHLLHLRERGIEVTHTPPPILSRNRGLLTERIWRELPELYMRLSPMGGPRGHKGPSASPRRSPSAGIPLPRRGSDEPPGFYRFLIPGPGKPWVRFQAIYVERGKGNRGERL
jgi:hypothetical protein